MKYLPAAQNVADTIGRNSGLESAEVVRRMAVVTADQKFHAAAEMIYDSSDLPGLVPYGVVREQWSMPAPEQQVQRGVGAGQNRSSQQAPGQGQPGPGQVQVSGPQEPVRSGGPQGAALPPDVAAAARAGLSGARPLTSASRLAADQQGSRRTTSPAGPERQTPSHER